MREEFFICLGNVQSLQTWQLAVKRLIQAFTEFRTLITYSSWRTSSVHQPDFFMARRANWITWRGWALTTLLSGLVNFETLNTKPPCYRNNGVIDLSNWPLSGDTVTGHKRHPKSQKVNLIVGTKVSSTNEEKVSVISGVCYKSIQCSTVIYLSCRCWNTLRITHLQKTLELVHYWTTSLRTTIRKQ